MGAAGWRRTRQVRTAAAVLPVLLRSWERIALAELPDLVAARTTAWAITVACGDAGRVTEAVAAAQAGYSVPMRSFVALPDAHVGAEPLYVTYAAELTALLGTAAYAELARLCAERRGLLPEHPATAAAGCRSAFWSAFRSAFRSAFGSGGAAARFSRPANSPPPEPPAAGAGAGCGWNPMMRRTVYCWPTVHRFVVIQ